MAEEISIEMRAVGGKKKAGSKTVSAAVFGVSKADHVLYQTVRWQGAKRRSGTHTVLTRAEVSGGGAKPWKQKGTGRARSGSNSSPLWVGGGIAHGPKQRSYEFSLNKKERRQALKSALSARLSEGKLIHVESLGLEAVSTKAAVAALNGLGLGPDFSALVVLPEGEETSTKSLRNIRGIKPVSALGLNVYDVLNNKYLVIVGDALQLIEERLDR